MRALQDVSFDLHAGQVTALVGENGAGKSTLVKILTGIYRPDEGEMSSTACRSRFASPRDAWAAGIAAIHQETVMFDELSVAENVFMGHMPAARRARRLGAMRTRATALLERLEAISTPTHR